MVSIGDVAKQSGVTVRALRHYEDKGLLAPQRSESGQRVYRYRDILRLQQIQLLKRTGFSLEQIAGLLRSQEIPATDLLRMQKTVLEEKQKEITISLQAVEDTLTQLEARETSDLSTLCNMIKLGENAMSEEKWQKVWDKFYSPEDNVKWAKAKAAIPDDVITANERAWPDLLARTEKLVGTDPASPEAQAIVKEWNAMTQAIYDVDPSLMGKAAQMYDNMDDWPKDGPEKPFSNEVWAFVKAAEKAAQS
ncbi:MerR family transcriptional regulator [Kordiimonas laminariae]|uniref:MerR family transcriptional regulator n=1 Tax=Kordiimonas laminariae TaxID=2917717 RepID=UPI001FF56455|nr:MerR family transcriptional regulator [Kordiimonas laminariae]MCK0069974.1 MerR family transcriptional regulator [Kordiimonas laminariae]